jgi:putative ABC transport system permease protein
MKTLSGTQWANFLTGDMAPRSNVAVLCLGGAAALLLALVSGLIPALYSTSFQPALVLKGSFALSAKGGGLRTVTLILQYVLSFLFILCAMMLQRQTSYMVHNNQLGFNYDRVLKMESHGYSKVKDVAEQLRNIPGVIDVARGDVPIQEGTSSTSAIQQGEDLIQYSFRSASPEYAGFFGFQLKEGRLPLPDESGVALVNESFNETFPTIGTGEIIHAQEGDYLVIGILKDFHARTLEHAFSPLAFFINDNWNFASFMIRVEPNADVPDIMQKARKTYSEMTGMEEASIEVGFLNKDIEKLYEQEIRQTRLIRLSSLLSLIITLIGVLGLVWFDTRFMRKEIALRKVNGATRKEILFQLGRKYLLIVAMGFVIAPPIAVAICQRWLQHFAFRTNMPGWIFVLALAIVTVITLLVVITQGWLAASANPVDSLKNE